jgi:hypothetical protein
MAKEGRDENGRFKKGVSGNPSHRFNAETAQEAGRRSQEAQREKKTIADALRAALYAPDPENPKQTMIESITGGAIGQMNRNKNIAEVRTLADILGELTQKVDVNGEIDLAFKFGGE